MIPLDVSLLETYVAELSQQAQRFGAAEGVMKVIVTRGCGGRAPG